MSQVPGNAALRDEFAIIMLAVRTISDQGGTSHD